jgi:hypothetical protein
MDDNISQQAILGYIQMGLHQTEQVGGDHILQYDQTENMQVCKTIGNVMFEMYFVLLLSFKNQNIDWLDELQAQ